MREDLYGVNLSPAHFTSEWAAMEAVVSPENLAFFEKEYPNFLSLPNTEALNIFAEHVRKVIGKDILPLTSQGTDSVVPKKSLFQKTFGAVKEFFDPPPTVHLFSNWPSPDGQVQVWIDEPSHQFSVSLEILLYDFKDQLQTRQLLRKHISRIFIPGELYNTDPTFFHFLPLSESYVAMFVSFDIETRWFHKSSGLLMKFLKNGELVECLHYTCEAEPGDENSADSLAVERCLGFSRAVEHYHHIATDVDPLSL